MKAPLGPQLPKLKLPWWMDGKTITSKPESQEPAMLGSGMQSFWQRLRNWFIWPLVQMDPLTCSLELLNLLAWERNITRFKDEPMWLYRKRVAYAFINARAAGSTLGFIEIMSRLNLSVISITERQPDLDWDVISIELDDSELANTSLVNVLIQDYGRTCRRYNYVSSRAAVVLMPVTECNNDYQTLTARMI